MLDKIPDKRWENISFYLDTWKIFNLLNTFGQNKKFESELSYHILFRDLN